MDPRPPASVAVAAILTGLQAAFLLGYAVVEILHVRSSTATVAVTTSLFFAAYAVALAWCARGLLRLRGWARGPVVVTQLIALLLGYDFRGGDTSVVALVLVLVAVVTLGCLLHPATTEALAAD